MEIATTPSTLSSIFHSPALSPMPLGRNFSGLDLSRISEDAGALSGLRSEICARSRLLYRRHVYQLRHCAVNHHSNCCAVVGSDRLVDHQRCDLGSHIVPVLSTIALLARVLSIYLDQTLDPETR